MRQISEEDGYLLGYKPKSRIVKNQSTGCTLNLYSLFEYLISPILYPPPLGRALPALIADDFGGCRRVPRWVLTTRCHCFIIGGKSNDGKDASLQVEMGNRK